MTFFRSVQISAIRVHQRQELALDSWFGFPITRLLNYQIRPGVPPRHRSQSSQFGVGLSDTRVEQPPSAVQIPQLFLRVLRVLRASVVGVAISRSPDYSITKSPDGLPPVIRSQSSQFGVGFNPICRFSDHRKSVFISGNNWLWIAGSVFQLPDYQITQLPNPTGGTPRHPSQSSQALAFNGIICTDCPHSESAFG